MDAEWTRLASPWAAWTAALAGGGNGAATVRGDTAGMDGDRRGAGGGTAATLASVRLVLARSIAMTTSCGGVGPSARGASFESVACRLRFLLPAPLPSGSTYTGGGDGGPPDDAAEDMDDERDDLASQSRRGQRVRTSAGTSRHAWTAAAT